MVDTLGAHRGESAARAAVPSEKRRQPGARHAAPAARHSAVGARFLCSCAPGEKSSPALPGGLRRYNLSTVF